MTNASFQRVATRASISLFLSLVCVGREPIGRIYSSLRRAALTNRWNPLNSPTRGVTVELLVAAEKISDYTAVYLKRDLSPAAARLFARFEIVGREIDIDLSKTWGRRRVEGWKNNRVRGDKLSKTRSPFPFPRDRVPRFTRHLHPATSRKLIPYGINRESASPVMRLRHMRGMI